MADQKMERMKELVTRLRAASRAYYQESRELMSNYEYDSLYDELTVLEKETGTVLAGSPTVNVGYEVVSELPKERHEQPMLSLDKTKSVEELAAFAGEHRSLLSWKLDGLTIVLTYRDGALFKAVTRGNGEVGEVITAMPGYFATSRCISPMKASCPPGRGGDPLLRVLKKSMSHPVVDAKYKNPRNLCSRFCAALNSQTRPSGM